MGGVVNPLSVPIFVILITVAILSMSMGLTERRVWLDTYNSEAREEMRINFIYAQIATVFAILLFASEYSGIVAFFSKN